MAKGKRIWQLMIGQNYVYFPRHGSGVMLVTGDSYVSAYGTKAEATAAARVARKTLGIMPTLVSVPRGY